MASFHLAIASQYLPTSKSNQILSCEILVERVANKCWIIHWTSPGMHAGKQGREPTKGRCKKRTTLNTHINNFDKLKVAHYSFEGVMSPTLNSFVKCSEAFIFLFQIFVTASNHHIQHLNNKMLKNSKSE